MTYVAWGEKLGKPECPYLIRWVINFVITSLRLHHWLYGDDPRAKHNHTWWFVTIPLWGSYTDRHIDPDDLNGSERTEELHGFRFSKSFPFVQLPTVRFRPAKWIHTVDVHKGGCWTFMITGPQTHKWGFFTHRADGTLRFTKSNKYFIENGHHPCQ